MLRRFFPATQSPARATVDIDRGELDSLQQRLSQLVSESELLMQISYTKWKIDREKERQIYLTHGVTFPETQLRRQQDEFFFRLESRMEQERADFQNRMREIEWQEQRRIEDERAREIALTEAQGAECRRAEQEAISRAAGHERHAIEQARIAAGREAAELLARALAGDLK